MASPPPRNPNNAPKPESETETTSIADDNQNIQLSDTSLRITEDLNNDVVTKQQHRNNAPSAPYTIPPWSGTPKNHFFLEVLKDGTIIDQFDVDKKGAYVFGRVDLCDFVLDHPTISRFHAVLQFNNDERAFLYDLGSTHGTFINKSQVKNRDYVNLHVGDVIRFGHSSRLYIFQGPSGLMPPEADLRAIRKSKIRLEMQDMEASLLRARVEASLADGISWGMGEDAIEADEDDIDQITWQTYKGQLTEKQERTREKVIKRLEKVAHMKKEIDVIRAKDISQGGMTQGQQTQIARNEQRISQIMEELENLEETLNGSIRESMGARAGRLLGGKQGMTEHDEEDYLSDDDEFYDRTKKPSKQKDGENQSVETADSLLDKKADIMKRIEENEKLLLDDEDKSAAKNVTAEIGDDALDAYMSAVSSQLVLDRKEKLSEELEGLHSELHRILYLLKIADPKGEAAKKRESQGHNTKAIMMKKPLPDKKSGSSLEKNHEFVSKDSFVKPIEGKVNVKKSAEVKTNVLELTSETESSNKRKEPDTIAALINEGATPTTISTITSTVTTTSTNTFYIVPKPQWLGAVGPKKKQEISQQKPTENEEVDKFVDYKDRNTMLTSSSLEDRGLENAAPGLIIRKRKEVEISNNPREEVKVGQNRDSESMAASAVALLLKHSRGYHASADKDGITHEENVLHEGGAKKDAKKVKRVQGPDKPTFLENGSDDTWMPPEGQSGDGRTSLNDQFGY